MWDERLALAGPNEDWPSGSIHGKIYGKIFR
jgi:hypothetical protein